MDLGPAIQDSSYIPQVKGSMDKNGRLSPVIFERVDWDVTIWETEMSSYLHQIWDVEQISGFFVVVNMLKIWVLWEE